MPEILLAEDDADVRKWVSVALRSENYTVRTAEDGIAALAAYAEHRPDLLVLDVMMPGKDGFTVCAEVRATDATLPILMLTARSKEQDKIRGLGLGADDYMTKPFSLGEFLARVKALLRRSHLVPPPQNLTHASFTIGGSRVDGTHLVLITDTGEETPLAAREYELLRLLAEHPNEILRRDRLLDEIWGVTYYGNTRTLDQHVALIRRKLGAESDRLETVRNVGYRLRT